ncbi:MAG: hypothetical protein ACKODX_07145, partial [Gemmata sp.]
MSADTVTPPPLASQRPTVPATSKGRRRWLYRLLPVPAMLALVVWFAPVVVAKTGLRNRVAREALANVRGSVEIGGASLGWLSPVELRDVVVKDASGRALLAAPKISSGKTLLALARERADPGEFTVENPRLAVVFEKGTTNIEGALEEYLKDSTPPSPARTPVRLTVTGGTLTVHDADDGRRASIEGIAAKVSVPANRAEPVALHVTAGTGGIDVEASVGESGSAKVRTSGLALDTFAPLVKRFSPGTSVEAVATADVCLTWGKDAQGRPTATVAGTASATRLSVAAPALNGDRLAFDSVALPLDLQLAGRSLCVRRFDLTCDVGSVSVAGTFDPDEDAEHLLARAGLSVNADIEVATLADKLPRLLRLKAGTELREGKIVVRLSSKADPAGTVWEGKVDTSALRATRDGTPVAWEQPLHVEFLGRYAEGRQPTFDKLVCTSDFIALNARVTPDTVQAAANINLNKLRARLADFVNLGDVVLDGEAAASLVGQRHPDGTFRAEATVALKNFKALDHNGRGLTEPALRVHLAATGKAPDGALVRLDTASGT